MLNNNHVGWYDSHACINIHANAHLHIHTHSVLCWKNTVTHSTLIWKQMFFFKKWLYQHAKIFPIHRFDFLLYNSRQCHHTLLYLSSRWAAEHNLRCGACDAILILGFRSRLLLTLLTFRGRKYLSQSCSMLLSVTCQRELIHQAMLEMLKQSRACYLGNKPCMAEERCRERKKDEEPIGGALTLLKW